MAYYFRLQWTRIARWFIHRGIQPLIGLAIGTFLFGLLSFYMFYKTAFAEWLYSFIAICFIMEMGNSTRMTLLNGIFQKAQLRKIRIVENLMVAVPFVAFLVFQQKILIALGLIIMAFIFSMVEFKRISNRVIPTPFRKIPFESIVGFRKYFWMVLISYFLGIQGVLVENLNLALFSFAIIFLLVMTFYAKPENIQFVWIYKKSRNKFLLHKVCHGIIAATILGLPLLIMLAVIFHENLLFVLLIQFVGSLLIGLMVITKYSAYPYEINVPQGIFLTLCVWLPPLLLITAPIFYIQSKKRLETYLYD